MRKPLKEPVSTAQIHRARLQALAVGSILLVLLLGTAYYIYVVRKPKAVSSTQVSATPSVSLNPTAVAPLTPPPTSSATPTPTPSPSSSVVLPSGAQAFIANFYASYEAKDRVRLETFFTPDTDPTIKALRASLFEGNGGPTLFSSDLFLESPQSYQITAASQNGTSWVVSVSENRQNGGGTPIAPETNLITLVPADQNSGGWLISSYAHSGTTGKYSGFSTLST